jgi:OOP family OmpA-OmpF porin
MDNDYSWNGGLRGTSSFRLPENEGVGKWIAVALLVAVVLHALMFIMLSRIDISLPKFVDESGIQTEVVRVNRVDMDDSRPELNRPEPSEPVEPVPIVPPADELDMLENIADVEIDISPEIEMIQVPMSSPAEAGVLEGEAMKDFTAPVFEPDLPDMGKTEDFFPRSRDSQVAVDPGARETGEHDPDAYTDALRKGAGGESDDGLLKDFTSLDAMARMDGNSLVTTKALIGSDLLFDFNSATLRQSARVSLMKVALLIDKHPKLICWVDGHTDLIGGEEPNLTLSQRRAMAVKMWLVKTLDLDEQRIAVRGFGKSQPLVKGGSIEKQAPNRRVEIKMRRSRPENEVMPGQAGAEAVRAEASLPRQAEAVEKVPARAVPVEEDVLDTAPSRVPPRAIEEPEGNGFEAPPRRAIPVDE